MPIETSVDREREMTVHRCTGRVVVAEVLAALDAFYGSDELPDRVLWDLRGAEVTGLDGRDLRRIATHPARFGPEGRVRRGRRALLVDSDVAYGLARMLDSYKQLESGLDGYQTMGFRDVEQALLWLAGG